MPKIKLYSLAFVGLILVFKGDCSEKDGKALAISITADVPLNYDNPKIIVKYHNQSEEKEILLFLPAATDVEMKRYRGIAVQIDSKDADFALKSLAPHLDNFVQSRNVKVKPGEATTIEINLRDIYTIPKDWKKIEIRPEGGLGGTDPITTIGVVIERKAEKAVKEKLSPAPVKKDGE